MCMQGLVPSDRVDGVLTFPLQRRRPGKDVGLDLRLFGSGIAVLLQDMGILLTKCHFYLLSGR
jgi:hypothetical protein